MTLDSSSLADKVIKIRKLKQQLAKVKEDLKVIGTDMTTEMDTVDANKARTKICDILDKNSCDQ
jgi:hypothetical protein